MIQASQTVLEEAINIFKNEIAPISDDLDNNSEKLAKALDLLYAQELLALKCEPNTGLKILAEKEYRKFHIEAFRISGALAFLQHQAQTAARLISLSENTELKSDYLAPMSRGEKKVGLGYAHLRKEGPPKVIAEKTENGYLLNGTVPWVTGEGLFNEFVIGANTSNGGYFYGITPYNTYDNSAQSTQPHEFIAMNSTRVVSVRLKNYFIPTEKVIMIKQDELGRANALTHGLSAIGCAWGAIDHCKDLLKSNPSRPNENSIEDFEKQLIILTKECLTIENNADISAKISLKAKCTDLALKCAYGGIILSSAEAILTQNRALRFYREILVHTLAAQTTEIREASLRQLASNIQF